MKEIDCPAVWVEKSCFWAALEEGERGRPITQSVHVMASPWKKGRLSAFQYCFLVSHKPLVGTRLA